MSDDPKTLEEAKVVIAKMVGEALREQFLPGFAMVAEAARPAERESFQLMLQAAREIVEGLEAGRSP
jgi:hypothetical protein